MKHLRDALEVVALLAFIAFILLLCYFVIHGARKVKSLGDEASATLTNFNRTIVIASGAFTNVEKGARAWEKNSDTQAKIATEALTNLNASAKSLDSLIRSTDSSLNAVLLPTLSRAIDEQNAALLITQKQVGEAVTAATATLADADKHLNDPAIEASLANLAAATKEFDTTAEQAAAIATDGRLVADKFRETYLKPQKFAWELLKQLIGIGGSLAQMIK